MKSPDTLVFTFTTLVPWLEIWLCWKKKIWPFNFMYPVAKQKRKSPSLFTQFPRKLYKP